MVSIRGVARIFQRGGHRGYSPDMFFSKLEPKIPFVRLQTHESLLSHLMNSTDYIVNIQLISFISTCFELRDKLIPGIINPTDG